MTLDNIPGKKVFAQRDVRETPASTATATSVGLTDGKYIVVDYHADMTDERKITAGEGIDFNDNGANSTFEILGEDATTANKGIASFNATDFSVSSGAVSLQAERIQDLVGAMVTGNTETGMTVTYQDGDGTLDFVNDGVTSAVAGEGIDVSAATGEVTISGENATTSNKGVVELATIAETQTGTSETLAVCPNSLFEVLVPIGAIIAWAKSMTGVPGTLPTSFVECDGSVINDAASPMNGETLPDLNGDNRFLRGNSTSGGTGGESTHVLTESEMPSHDHSFYVYNNEPGTHTQPYGGYGSATTNITTTSKGSDAAHENKPPYYDIVWIMRIK